MMEIIEIAWHLNYCPRFFIFLRVFFENRFDFPPFEFSLYSKLYAQPSPVLHAGREIAIKKARNPINITVFFCFISSINLRNMAENCPIYCGFGLK